MPYVNERASRLGHVPTVSNQAVLAALQGWEVTHGPPDDPNVVHVHCLPVADLPDQEGTFQDVRFCITVDGSDTEVEATRQHPTVKVGYLRVAGSVVDLQDFRALGDSKFVDPKLLRKAHTEYAFDAALPGSGLARPGMTGRDTWRVELNDFLTTARFDANTTMTLADGLRAVHGKPGAPTASLTVRVCPSCQYRSGTDHGDITVGSPWAPCPACAEPVYLADVLRLHEEFNQEGSNFTPVTRAMNMAERLMTACYIEYFFSSQPEVLRQTIFVTDGPLALHGPLAPQSRAFLAHHQGLVEQMSASSKTGPLLVGVEKSGAFVEHAELIADLIEPGSVMMLTNDYINRITGRPVDNRYGEDEFYGRRFIYRATNGDTLVITVVPKPGVAPYSANAASEDFASYPHLGLVCQLLDSLRTRMYHNAVIPVALAHSSASLPLGVGRSVLTMMAQHNIPGLAKDHQAIKKPTYFQ